METLNQALNNNKIPIIISVLGVVLILGGLFSSNLVNHFKTSKAESFPKGSLVEQSSGIKVDISGAVKSPGVYQIPGNFRVEDAIASAGGLTENVNKEYVSKSLNLSQKLSDGQKIYIPFQGENNGGVVAGANSGGSGAAIVGINSATQAQLEALPGIGPVSAQKIIDNRPYSSLDDLSVKKIISKSTFEKIKGSIDVN